MAPRSASQKRRSRPRDRGASGLVGGGRYRGAASTAAAGAGGGGAPPSASAPYAYDFDDDDEPASSSPRLFGFSLPNPLSRVRALLASGSASGRGGGGGRGSSPSIPLLGLPPLAARGAPYRVLLVVGTAAILLAPMLDALLRETTSFLRGSPLAAWVGAGGGGIAADSEGVVGDALPHVTSDGRFHGRYPNSLLTLFYPFTLFRDVVLNQPVGPDDVPFFWHAHVSDERAVKKALRKCYDADLVELDTTEDVAKAKRLKLVETLASEGKIGKASVDKEKLYRGQRRRPVIVASPHIRETAELFSQTNMGRGFAFYRHPIDYDVHPDLKRKLPPEAGANNFLARLLSDVHTGPLAFKELGIAKQVIRQTTVAGTRDLLGESLFRIGKYFGWVPAGGSGTKEGEEADDALARTCIEGAIEDVPGERYADHNSPEWQVFYKANQLDCQLYEIARSTWRAQIQTIIPLTLQKKRAGEEDEDEKTDKDGEG